ncbi:pyridoxal phosphate-dependent transferase [Rhodotorula diobovata]|uniref:Pyridoxal phosphate-dependent transferase n=1 Tax=Rhodotorula diobovata TaxID=5288 RepID=A0A5C5FT91_9BASI|nr:pyridoxal phosphate-dependent transferase [Rhodotorula diobovata]
MTTHSLFFYGTLCHAAVLARVLGHPGEALATKDALLVDHARLHVNGEDYPAVVRSADGAKVLGRGLSKDEASVRGVLVQGLTDDDIALLDEFEGDEYTRAPCTVEPLPSATPSDTLNSTASASVYLWTAPLSRLTPSIWTFEQFLRESAHRWVGVGAEDNPDYAEVDRRRQMKGVITPRGVQESAEAALEEVDAKLQAEQPARAAPSANGSAAKELASFGRSLRAKYFSHEAEWIPLNHGSYGAAPTPVLERFRALQDQADASADRFMKTEYEALLLEARTRVAEFIDCDTDDVVFVTNATTGVNTVLRGLTTEWRKGDRILYFPTSIYNACERTLQYIVDSHPHLDLSLLPVPITYPISHADLVSRVSDALTAAEQDGTGRKVRLALIDGISASPGVVVPWPELVTLLRSRGVLSLVDAAHQFGQLSVSLRESKPDFWVSNAHKWGLVPRTCAVLYVSKPWQHLVHSIPIGFSYQKRDPSVDGNPGWVKEFNWSGTIDWSPVLATTAALDFRRDVLGGEERIYDYCHSLALEGGELVAQILGTEVLRNEKAEDGELTACMVNVSLPLPAPSTYSPQSLSRLTAFWISRLSTTHKTFAPLYVHDDTFWVRLSAQVYVELLDFREGGEAIRSVCDEIKRGEFKKV